MMSESSKASFSAAVQVLQARLDCGDQAVATQDYRHLSLRQFLILFVGWKRHSVKHMVMSKCLMKPGIPYCMDS